jgi:hypothetical protein
VADELAHERSGATAVAGGQCGEERLHLVDELGFGGGHGAL